MEQSDVKKQQLVEALATIDNLPVIPKEEVQLSTHMRIPFDELAALGGSFAALSSQFRTVVETLDIPAQGLCRPYAKKGATGVIYEKDGLFNGNVCNPENGQISSRLSFEWVDSVSAVKKTQIPADPATVMMIAALASINRKLDQIEETQQEVFGFMKTDKIAQLEANAQFLTDTLNNYKYNIGNKTYATNMHVKVLDIRQTAEHNINFYQKQIEQQGNKHSAISAKFKAVQDGFKNYQLALYLYGFSSFLEVLLLENFESGYLRSVVHSLEEHAYEYRELYTKWYNKLDEQSKSSIQSTLLNGLATVSESVGGAAAKIPVIRKTPIDDALLDAGEQLSKTTERNHKKAMSSFASKKETCVYPFIQLVQTIDDLYNQPREIWIGRDALYITE